MKADKNKTIRKLKTVSGQIDGLIKMIEDDRYCIDISNQVMASISILKNINKDVLRGHLEHCVYDSLKQENEEDIKEKIEEIEKIIDKLNKI
ncbi:metal-sensing transcriptional repressor [Anaerococcus murdochii]|uniref:metal-sensing transcriptional repressor n=1 Tax=Anaerococcus murdochii TaxID=411577 RepID=UPI0032B5AC61